VDVHDLPLLGRARRGDAEQDVQVEKRGAVRSMAAAITISAVVDVHARPRPRPRYVHVHVYDYVSRRRSTVSQPGASPRGATGGLCSRIPSFNVRRRSFFDSSPRSLREPSPASDGARCTRPHMLRARRPRPHRGRPRRWCPYVRRPPACRRCRRMRGRVTAELVRLHLPPQDPLARDRRPWHGMRREAKRPTRRATSETRR
jgi:hypothetical protein